MAKIIKAFDWEAENLNIYEYKERKDISQNAAEQVWKPQGVKQKGTVVNEQFLNNMSKNGVYGILETSKETVEENESYKIINFEGIEEFEVFEGLKLKLRISDTNNMNSPKLCIGEEKFSLVFLSNDEYINLNAGQLEKGQIYNVVFDGANFIVENSSLQATEKGRGIISGLDIRSTEAAYILGCEYGGVFGAGLTSVEKGKTYYYYDTVKKLYTPYQALQTKTGSFITPDVINFKNISNGNLSQIVEDIEGFRFIIDKEQNMLRAFRYDRAAGTNTKTMKWVYDQIVGMLVKHGYNLVNNVFLSSYYVHQASNIKASYSTYYNSTFICYIYEGNQVVDVNNWFFHTGELIMTIV